MEIELPLLMVLEAEEGRMILYGAEFATRSDGTGAYAVAQAYSSNEDIPVGTELVDEEGEKYQVIQKVSKGFHWTGMVVEWTLEEDDADTI